MELCLDSNSLHFFESVTAKSHQYQFFFLYFKLLCCLGIFSVLLPLIRLFQHLGNVYFIFQMFSGMFGENRSLKWIHVICHTRDIPLNKKLAKQRLVKIMLVKIEYLNAQCKEHNVNKHNFTLDKKYCLQEKLFLSKKTSLALINSWYMGNC